MTIIVGSKNINVANLPKKFKPSKIPLIPNNNRPIFCRFPSIRGYNLNELYANRKYKNTLRRIKKPPKIIIKTSANNGKAKFLPARLSIKAIMFAIVDVAFVI